MVLRVQIRNSVAHLPRWAVLLWVGAIAFSPRAQADTLTLLLKNGDRLSGELLQEAGGNLSLRHPTLGVLQVPLADIAQRSIAPAAAADSAHPTSPPAVSTPQAAQGKLTATNGRRTAERPTDE